MGEEKEKPLTREDVLREIDKCRSKGEVPNFSNKVFEEGIDLRQFNLLGIILKKARLYNAHLEGAFLAGAQLQEAGLTGAHLKGAILMGTNLEGTYLKYTSLQEADLTGVKLSRAWLEGAKLSSTTALESVDWGRDYICGEEASGNFGQAERTYRPLKMWYTNAGMYDIAGEFFYREMEAKRKARSWKKEPHLKLWCWVMRLLCGYGEKPWRVAISAAVLVVGLAVIYFFLDAFSPGTFPGCLYYSVASFTALGYGNWVYPEPESWAKGLGAAEAALGVFMIALFLITFVRKMTR